MGDATNLVLIFAGELLKQTESLLMMGLHPSEVIQGYELARTKALEALECKGCCNLALHIDSLAFIQRSLSMHYRKN